MNADRTSEGYFLAPDGKTSGPFRYAEIVRRLRAGEIAGADPIWHAGMAEWSRVDAIVTLVETRETGALASAALLERVRRLEHLQIRNAIFLAGAIGGAMFLFVVGASLLQDVEIAGLLLLVLAIATIWWAWVEYQGITLADGQLRMPHRISVWPHILPLRRRTYSTDEIRIGSEFTVGPRAHILVLMTPRGQERLIFDSQATREILVLGLVLAGAALPER